MRPELRSMMVAIPVACALSQLDGFTRAHRAELADSWVKHPVSGFGTFNSIMPLPALERWHAAATPQRIVQAPRVAVATLAQVLLWGASGSAACLTSAVVFVIYGKDACAKHMADWYTPIQTAVILCNAAAYIAVLVLLLKLML